MKIVIYLSCTCYLLSSCGTSSNSTNNKSIINDSIPNKKSNTSDSPNLSIEYKSIDIGNQTWMAENLNISTFRNGDTIPESKSRVDWQLANEEKKPSWCYYEFNADNGKKYGKLYNGWALKDERVISPVGWHVASKEEWYLMYSNAGGKTKYIKSSKGWLNDYSGDNTSLFNAVPNGCVNFDGMFANLGYAAFFWTSDLGYNDEYGNYSFVMRINPLSDEQFSGRNSIDFGLGHAIRCIKDKNGNDNNTNGTSIEEKNDGNKVLFRCTPNDDNVNVRAAPNKEASLLFQLDKSQYFDVIALDKQDVIRNNKGQWYRIIFEGKEGFIFSYYTDCN